MEGREGRVPTALITGTREPEQRISGGKLASGVVSRLTPEQLATSKTQLLPLMHS